MCSSRRGPATMPSLVTCPTISTGVWVALAYCSSRSVDSRTCVTLPGAEAGPSARTVWMESTTSIPARRRSASASAPSMAVSAYTNSPCAGDPHALRAHPDLRGRLLRRHVQAGTPGRRQFRGQPQHQRGLAHAWVARPAAPAIPAPARRPAPGPFRPCPRATGRRPRCRSDPAPPPAASRAKFRLAPPSPAARPASSTPRKRCTAPSTADAPPRTRHKQITGEVLPLAVSPGSGAPNGSAGRSAGRYRQPLPKADSWAFRLAARVAGLPWVV